MSDFHPKYTRKHSNRQSIDQYYLNFLARSIVILSLNLIGLAPLLALPTAPNTNGTPGDNDASKHRQEASAIQTVNAIAPPLTISGRVFEDPN